MIKLLPSVIATVVLSSEAHAVDREVLRHYTLNFSLERVYSESKKALLSVHGLNFGQEIRDFQGKKTPSFYQFQSIIQSYDKSKYCDVSSYEVSAFAGPIYYMPAVKNKVTAVLESKNYMFDYYRSTLKGVQLYKHKTNGVEKLAYVHKNNPTHYILSICTLKGG